MKGIVTLRSVAFGAAMLFSGQAAFAGGSANELFVEAVQSLQAAEAAPDESERLEHLAQAVGAFDAIVRDFPSSDLAVQLITQQPIGAVDPMAVRQQHDELAEKVAAMAAAEAAQAEEAAQAAKDAARRKLMEDAAALQFCVIGKDCFDAKLADQLPPEEVQQMRAVISSLRGNPDDAFDSGAAAAIAAASSERGKIMRTAQAFAAMVAADPDNTAIAVRELDETLNAITSEPAQAWQTAASSAVDMLFRFGEGQLAQGFMAEAERQGFVDDGRAMLDQIMQQKFGMDWAAFSDFSHSWRDIPLSHGDLERVLIGYSSIDPAAAQGIATDFFKADANMADWAGARRTINFLSLKAELHSGGSTELLDSFATYLEQQDGLTGDLVGETDLILMVPLLRREANFEKGQRLLEALFIAGGKSEARGEALPPEVLMLLKSLS